MRRNFEHQRAETKHHRRRDNGGGQFADVMTAHKRLHDCSFSSEKRCDCTHQTIPQFDLDGDRHRNVSDRNEGARRERENQTIEGTVSDESTGTHPISIASFASMMFPEASLIPLSILTSMICAPERRKREKRDVRIRVRTSQRTTKAERDGKRRGERPQSNSWPRAA